MARRVRAPTLESRTARLRLTPRRKPYGFVNISRGLAIAYRRNQGVGTWVLRAANGHGGYWTDAIGLADDHEEADGERILSFWQAQDKARALVRGQQSTGDRPATVADALDVYERDLAARGGRASNALYARSLLPASILAKPVGLLTSHALRHWRDGLLTTREPSSVTRVCKSLKASLNLAARHDARITNRAAWDVGLAALPDSHVARHVGLPVADVRAIVAAAYVTDPALGLWTEVAATTGARPSQLARLDVGDLQNDRADPRLMMPSSRKGKGKKRIDRRPVPIPAALAAKLHAVAGGRPANAPLLLDQNGVRWCSDCHVRPFARAATAAGLPKVTAYALRHSSIIRSLLANVPTRVTAALHDTSVPMLERSYSAYILDHSDAVSRRALLDLSAVVE